MRWLALFAGDIEKLFQSCDRDNGNACSFLRFITAIDKTPCFQDAIRKNSGNDIQPLEEVTGDGHAGFDFDRENVGTNRKQEVHFIAFAIPVEIDIASFAAVELVLNGFGDDHVFEKIASERVSRNVGFIFDAEQVGGKADIVEIQFGRFYQAFGNVPVVGLQQ